MKRTNTILTILLFVQIIIYQIFTYFPDFIEKFYSNGIYIYISKLFRYVFGWIPFSVGDIIYGFIFIFIAKFFLNIIRSERRNFKEILLQIGSALSVVYFLFYMLWGLNYYRNSLFDSMKMEKQPFDKIALLQFTEKLLFETKTLQVELSKNDSVKVVVPYSKNQILDKTAQGYQNLSEISTQYNYHPISLKKSLFSLPLTYMGFAGYLNPLTGEANVDHLIPKVTLPMTCSHEVAHQLGIASESEANFIGFLAANKNDDKYFQYSAYLLAYRYALYDLSLQDETLFKEFIEKTPKGILKNFEEIELFWKEYENPTEPFFKAFYDNYLKINQQEEGIKSYSRMTDLLMAYDKKYGF
ncbi:MAG: DUF3810 domain-containing protein [Bacteroidota bacterium]